LHFRSAKKVEDQPKNFGLLQLQGAVGDRCSAEIDRMQSMQALILADELNEKTIQNLKLQIELLETHQQLREKTIECQQLQIELLKARGQLSWGQFHASILTNQILEENQNLHLQIQMNELEVSSLRHFKKSIAVVLTTGYHALGEMSWGS
jgi:ribosomal protein L29